MDPDSAPTLASSSPPPPRTPRTALPQREKSSGGANVISISDSSPSGGSHFVPGVVLLDRYRIVALAGKGGMGEVYRADDLKLGQTVALKFLPEALAKDGGALARFHREVRIARQVSHANVCRVFDIGEVDGMPFLTMEYVDGEDLASLVRRIGRLGHDKALEISRQICAGLAAAHAHGILHRDLKPANVMLDGRGKVRITDFGLAGLGEDLNQEDARAGTPAYMAPEQLEGREVTQKSDIYSLGLVLYEVFTGKKAFEGASFKDLLRARQTCTPPLPTMIAKDVDPLVERVILRCLEKEPAKRPATALQVAAALPGGDPLAAALAAGETPSPEMVAAAGETELLRPQIAWACVAALVVFTACAILVNQKMKLFRFVPLEKPPEVLAERAREIEKKFGYASAPVDSAYGFATDGILLNDIASRDKSKTRWNNLDRGEIKFWYRSSPRLLEAGQFYGQDLLDVGKVTWYDPPFDVSGMTQVRLNPQGKLLQFLAVPPQLEEPVPANAKPPDWNALFAEAGFDPAKWIATTPQWTPFTYCDTRAAWLGASPERPNEPLRIEAAAYRSAPVYFLIVGPWARPTRMQEFHPSPGQRTSNIILTLLLIALMIGAVYWARRNLQQGRGDRRGAFRLAAVLFALLAGSWVLDASHVPNFGELGLFIMFVSWALFASGLMWLMYMALEPLVRRLWPAAIVSWSRLLAGNWRDPLVGRDVLAGCVGGALFCLISNTASLVPAWLGHPPQQPDFITTALLLGTKSVMGYTLRQLAIDIFLGLALMFLMLFMRGLLRNEWLAGAGFVAVVGAQMALQTGEPLLTAPFAVLTWGLFVILLIRFGLVAATTVLIFDMFIDSFPITTDSSAWYAGVGYFALLMMALMAFYGFRMARGGKGALAAAAPG